MLAEILLVTAVIALFASWYVRIRIFAAAPSDRVIADMTEDTFATSFQDLLFIQLHRSRSQVDAQFRPLILAFFWLNIVAGACMAAAALAFWLAA